ncbi:MAG: hypothetical protein ACKO6A_01600 [Bacteroidota bacterium]
MKDKGIKKSCGPMYTAGTANIASMTIHHNATYPSKIELPVAAQVISVDENTFSQIKLFPNPTKGLVSIHSDEQPIRLVKIYYLMGNLVKESTESQFDF